jgi:hypothetical protein
MRARALAMVAASGLTLLAHSADRDRFVTGSAYGVAAGKATGGLADHSLTIMLPGAVTVGSSGHCYAWTRSGRFVPARCP